MTSTPETPDPPSEQELSAARSLYYRDAADIGEVEPPDWDAMTEHDREPWVKAIVGTRPGPTVKQPADHAKAKDDGSRVLTAEQLVDKAIERAGNGLGVVAFVGTMLGQLGEFVEANDLKIDWGSVMLRTTRTDKAGVEAKTHNIVPKGTLVLVLEATVRPSR